MAGATSGVGPSVTGMAARQRGQSWPLFGLLALLVILATAYLLGGTDPSATPTSASDLASVDVADLPPEALATLDLIAAGGPYPHEQDGDTFFNREGLLPTAEEGFYREYTVPTPGADDRGPRRIVTGRDGTAYYTADHYDSFTRIRDP